MALQFQYHYRDSWDDHGQYGFVRTGVEYGHDGTKNLKFYVPIPQAVYQAQVLSGTFSIGFRYDGNDFRTPFKVLCDTDGAAVVLIRFRLPLDFASFPDAALELSVSRNAGSQTAGLTLAKGGVADTTIDDYDITPSTEDVWEVFGVGPASSYGRGDWLSILVNISAIAGEHVELSDLSLSYVNGRGNV
jgi:hypothetical protein